MCGFSGTNDNRHLLPFTVVPLHASGAATRGTDGKMVHVLSRPGKCTFESLLDPTAGHRGASAAALGAPPQAANVASERAALGPPADSPENARQPSKAVGTATGGAYHGAQLLKRVVQLGADALIDAGALLAGMAQETVARQLLAGFAERADGVPDAARQHSTSMSAGSAARSATEVQEGGAARNVLGVVFYGRTGWEVMDTHGHVQSKATSPIKEHEAFVVFDEARCRYALVTSSDR